MQKNYHILRYLVMWAGQMPIRPIGIHNATNKRTFKEEQSQVLLSPQS